MLHNLQKGDITLTFKAKRLISNGRTMVVFFIKKHSERVCAVKEGSITFY